MSPADASTAPTLDLVDIIDFKWLAAKEGLHVHVERLQSDPGYARDCLARAAASPREAVREAAERLHRLLKLGSA